MNNKPVNPSLTYSISIILLASILLSACGPGQLFGTTITPSPTRTLTPTVTPTNTSTPTQTPIPTPFGGGTGKLAFSNYSWRIVAGSLRIEKTIYTVNMNGTELSLLSPQWFGYAPAWSPDGEKLLFTRYYQSEDTSGLEIMNADGSDPVELASGALFYKNFTWSPDGAKIVYESCASSGWVGASLVCLKRGLYALDADGSHRTLLSQEGYAPAWSPDGTRLAYLGTGQVILLETADLRQTRLTSNYGTKTDFAWSADGSKIIFVEVSGGNPSTGQIFMIQVDGSNLTQITNNTQGTYQDLDWSPDGKRIAFGYKENPNRQDIFVMNTDGSNLIQLSETDSISECAMPRWSPDGKAIAFVCGLIVSQSRIITIINMDTMEKTEIVEMSADPFGVKWQPMVAGSGPIIIPTKVPTLTPTPIPTLIPTC